MAPLLHNRAVKPRGIVTAAAAAQQDDLGGTQHHPTSSHSVQATH